MKLKIPPETILSFKSLCLLFFLIPGLSAAAEPVFKVGFVAPSGADDPFFSELIEVMKAAAEDLNIELNIKYSERGVSLYAKRAGLKLISSYKPDYFLTGFWPGGAKYHLKEAEESGIKSFVFNSPVEGDFSTGPRQALSHWIGQMTPDYRQASYQLADALIQAARRKLPDKSGKVEIIALSGNEDDVSAIQRIQGLKDRIREHNDAILREVILAGWSKEVADRVTENLLGKYPEVTVVWAASDHMAQGAADAVERMGKTPGKDIMIGGFDWNQKSLNDIKAGKITASMGGHILEGAFSLVLLYDYHKGTDFAGELGLKFHSPMHAITAENVGRYRLLIEGMNWEDVDFTRFSKVLNPSLKRYDFSLSTLFDAIDDMADPDKQ